MSVFEHRSFDGHEHVAFFYDQDADLKAIVAIHSSRLGVAMGGCRMFDYHSADEALNDVLRLSRGMTYKSAAANLKLGGGKSVIMGDPRKHKSEALLAAMGRCINTLGGRYIAAEDSGINERDMCIMARETDYVAGFSRSNNESGGERGDPSPATAYGVFIGLKAAVDFRFADRFQGRDLTGLKVAIQGLGNVGYRLAEHLHRAGAELWVNDIYEPNAERAVAEFGARRVTTQELFSLPVDVLAPCALGSVIDDVVLNQLRVGVIAGSANNQLAHDDLGAALKARDILYAPDYIINAGGIIDVYYQRQGLPFAQAHRHMTNSIPATLKEVFKSSERSGDATNIIADRVARARLEGECHPVDHVM